MGGATIFHVQQQLELSRTGLTDTHCVPDTPSQVHTRRELPLLDGHSHCRRSHLRGTFSCVCSDATMSTLFERW